MSRGRRASLFSEIYTDAFAGTKRMGILIRRCQNPILCETAHQMELCHSCIMQRLICMYMTYLYIQMRVNSTRAVSKRLSSELLLRKRDLTSFLLILNKQERVSRRSSTSAYVCHLPGAFIRKPSL